MAAMTRTGPPPQRGQHLKSISNTRRSRCIQLIGALGWNSSVSSAHWAVGGARVMMWSQWLASGNGHQGPGDARNQGVEHAFKLGLRRRRCTAKLCLVIGEDVAAVQRQEVQVDIEVEGRTSDRPASQ